ncbi:MAG: response regulator [Deltaproteobacteria bacterium]|nr:response regulator [Deltaproteobacteria bacterium]MBN2671303.1 response regulator [Deltaproteobacteria bacterium]
MTPLEYTFFIAGICSLVGFLGMLSAMESNRSIRSLQIYFGFTLLWVGCEFVAAQTPDTEIRIWLHRASGATAVTCAFWFYRFLYALRYKAINRLYRVLQWVLFISSALYLTTDWGIASIDDEPRFGMLEFGPFYYVALTAAVVTWILNAAGMQAAMQELPAYESTRKQSIFLLQLSTTVLSTIGIVAFAFSWVFWDVSMFFRWLPLLSTVFIPFFMVAFYKYGFLSSGMGKLARDLFTDAEDGIIIADEFAIVRQVNPAAVALLNAEAAKCECRPLSELLQRNLASGEAHRFELSPGDIPSITHYLVVSITPVITHTGASQHLVVMHNITDEKAAEEAANRSREDFEKQISQRTDELIELQEKEAIGTMAGSIAHDFNNLLAAVLGFATAAYQDLPDQTPLKRDVEEILNSAKQARGVVNQLLLFSRRQQSRRMILDVGEMLRATMPLVESSLPPNVKLRHTIMEQNVCVMASQTDLSQALMNLCTNAVQAIGRQDGELEIRVDIDVPGHTHTFYYGERTNEKNVKISVVDTGEGMSEEIKIMAFEPFFTTRENAIGFGLSTALRIASDHAGGIALEDHQPHGAVVSLCLPRLELEQLSPSEDTTNLTGGEKIMVIDDDERLLRLVNRLLSSVGYRVTTFNTPHAALQAFRRTPGAFDMIISDFSMPGLTGMELARLLIEEREDISVLLVSGNVSQEQLESAKEEGVRGFLRKPFGREELLGKIRRILNDRTRVSFL